MWPGFAPPITTNPVATVSPDKLPDGEAVLIRRAAMLVKTQIPGVIGEYLSRDLEQIASMGYRLDQTGLTARTVKAILEASSRS